MRGEPLGRDDHFTCRLPEDGLKGLTEECFQQTPLRFVGDKQWYNDQRSPEWREGRATRTDEGTHPAGSQWTMTRVFPARQSHYATRDLVQVPKDLKPGTYVLSFRWDCERTSQVWSGCSNIRVTPRKGRKGKKPLHKKLNKTGKTSQR